MQNTKAHPETVIGYRGAKAKKQTKWAQQQGMHGKWHFGEFDYVKYVTNVDYDWHEHDDKNPKPNFSKNGPLDLQ